MQKVTPIHRRCCLADGATLPEYAVLLSLVAVVCLGGIRTTGANSQSAFLRVRFTTSAGPTTIPRVTHGFNSAPRARNFNVAPDR